MRQRPASLFRQAVAVDATEPVTLSRYFEFEIAHSSSNAVVPGGADDPQRGGSLPQADRGPREPPLGVGEPGRCCSCSSGSPWRRWGDRAIDSARRSRPKGTVPSSRKFGRPGFAAGPSAFRRRPRLLRTPQRAGSHPVHPRKPPGFRRCRRAVMLGLAVGLGDPEAAERWAGWLPAEEEPLSAAEGIVCCSGRLAGGPEAALDAFKPLLLGPARGFRSRFSRRHGRRGLAGDGREGRRRPRASAICPAVAAACGRPASPGHAGSDFTPLGAAARLDRRCCRRRGSPSREAPRLRRRTNAQVEWSWPLPWAHASAWSKRGVPETPARRAPSGKTARTSSGSP